jgi:2-oxoglutarate dehydrogenase E2 component (dihydrolipoamide succinyltransferase)
MAAQHRADKSDDWVPVVVPRLGLPGASVRATLWHVSLGEPVRRGERLIELAAAGVLVDLPAPVAGVLRSQLVGEDESVEPGQILGLIEPEAAGE